MRNYQLCKDPFFLKFHFGLHSCFLFHWEDVERRGSGGVKRVHSQLLTPEAPEGKFDRLPVNQLQLYGTLPRPSAQHKSRAAGV